MEYKLFRDINIYDPFFESLKSAYAEFTNWYDRKSSAEDKAFVDYDEGGNLQAFLYFLKSATIIQYTIKGRFMSR